MIEITKFNTIQRRKVVNDAYIYFYGQHYDCFSSKNIHINLFYSLYSHDF